ncbi:MAG: undecaprenyl-diphosphate phosphatase [Pseudanabaena sp. M135S2SP2A07QC]|nr:undecaprenyl-diphosphate phosphatase [Pseudanabaena sp. M090S1SP2A07QC]MCA6505549.1 undecaprenyl-diphosphate phosphatase [Pseudanabaena sp. M172S2SP2A07QC]MCA6523090.1 undecaprenyl-diphosphate phosphatase [Pseudanabaena sp. M051S1SP2A07QC]MCA6524636.1 undecaprenyl-diphosphate phosphatase [Pseudanabaena sp. M179S2SP2A07QC]MCA6529106.1 undecaprenyl-diphosphate phosphatase [Pseudanabaena sp. M125S2SP2A07QC]MCA6533582.1 undecaprenyl-diphosphate phosphatase [Pseudanabaena sp. M176S2SP2A07QC]MCA
MEYWQAFVLGIVQGLTEFLPISSTAHLKVVPAIFGWKDAGLSFDAVIQLGSIAAVVGYFWKDLSNITLGSIKAVRSQNYKSQEFKLAVAIALGTIPILFGGLLIKIFVPDYDKSPLRSLTAIAIASIVMSSLLALAEILGQRGKTEKRQFHRVRVIDGILMGVAQTMALVPGVSRSGSTLTAGLFLGLDRVAATRFSFLLGIPAITIGGLVELISLIKKGFGDVGVGQLAIGLFSSVIFSYLAIAWLLKFFQTHTTWVFVGYRLIFGALLLTGLGLGWIK